MKFSIYCKREGAGTQVVWLRLNLDLNLNLVTTSKFSHSSFFTAVNLVLHVSILVHTGTYYGTTSTSTITKFSSITTSTSSNGHVCVVHTH